MALAATLSPGQARRKRQQKNGYPPVNAFLPMATTGSARNYGAQEVGMIGKDGPRTAVPDAGYCSLSPLRTPLDQIVFCRTVLPCGK